MQKASRNCNCFALLADFHGAYGGIVCLLAAGLVKKSQRRSGDHGHDGTDRCYLSWEPASNVVGQLLDWRTVYEVGLVALTAALLIVACVPTPDKQHQRRLEQNFKH